MADFGTLIGADWTIDRATKIIAYIGDDHAGASPTYATVIDFHRWLQSLGDDAFAIASTGDELDITSNDPSRRSTDNIITLINGYTLEQGTGVPAPEHLYDGTIIQDGGNTIWDGIVNFGNPGVKIQILQIGDTLSDDWWNHRDGVYGDGGLNYNDGQGISHRFMLKVREDGVDIDGRRLFGLTRVMDTAAGTNHFTFSEFRINGTARGNNVLALVNGDDLNNSTAQSTIAGWNTTDISINEGFNQIDVDANGSVEDYFTAFDTLTTHSQNDYYEFAKWKTRDGETNPIFGIPGESFRGVTHSFNYGSDGISAATGDRLVWGTYVNIGTITGTFQVGEVIFDGVTDVSGSAYLGRILAIDTVDTSLILYLESGVTIGNAATIEGVTSGASATTTADPTEIVGGGEFAVLANDDGGATGTLYVQVTKGTIPPNGSTVYDDADLTATLAVTSVPDAKTIQSPWIGVSTGTNIIGAYGVGFALDQINDGDTLTALDGNQYSRPNLVTNTVGGLTFSGDPDYVFVAPWDTDSADVGFGVGYDLNGDPTVNKIQMALATALSANDATSVVIGNVAGDVTSIPTDTPATGFIRVIDDNGFEKRIKYSSWTGSTFTIDTAFHTTETDSQNDFGGVTGSGTFQASVANGVFITYLDQPAEAATHNFQVTYSAPRDLVVVVRNGGSNPVKQFISEWSITSANQTINAIKTTDV